MKSIKVSNPFSNNSACVAALALVGSLLLPVATYAEENVVNMEKVSVYGASDGGILPNDRASDGVFAGGRSLEDSPRAATFISPELFQRYSLATPSDLTRFSPSTAGVSQFGNATTPLIRGDVAETYRNGQRTSANLFGASPSFNSVESAEVIRGPGSAVFGPGFYNGGYVNYSTKQADEDARHTVLGLTLGTWQPDGDSYLNSSWLIDHNEPLSPNSAIRLSYSGKENDTQYKSHGGRNDAEALYAAVVWKVSDSFTIDANAEYQWLANPQLLGVNRPSQELIDHGTYYAGEAPDVGWAMPWVITPTAAVKLPVDATVLSTGDFSNATRAVGQVILSAKLAEDWSLRNLSLAERNEWRRYHDFEYTEYATQLTAENRTELSGKFEALGFEQSLTIGASYRYESRESFVNYFNEYAFNFDITQPPPYSMLTQFPLTYYPGQEAVGGRQFFGAEAGSPESTDSNLHDTGVFAQHSLMLGEKFQLLSGVRGDLIYADARDPLPLPNTTAWSDAHDYHNYTAHVSLIYKPTSSARYYVTVNRTHAFNGSVAGGGLMLFNGRLDKNDFRNRSDLLEVGAKYSLLNNTLFLGVAGYEQQRSRTEFRGGKSDLQIRGIELEALWQQTDSLYWWGNATFTDGHYVDSAPYQLGGRSIYDNYALGTGPGNRGTGAGYEAFGANQVPVGDYRIPGLSRWMANGGVTAKLDCGFGATTWATFQSPQNGNLDAEFIIPNQFTINFGLFWQSGGWDVGVDLLNATNELNWTHNGDPFMDNQLISRDLPRRVEAHVRYEF
ncbi:MAG: TonB-dependent receptor [Verrucomicrobiota bacterium]|nr:TonB-dependent receptor [Verrucomicrobiota bacterium]